MDVVELLTSEVVTNAILHARSAPSLELFVSDQQVRVAVEDNSADQPHLAPLDATAPKGRGLRLVDEFAAFWGTNPLPGGRKRVWFEVPFAYH